MVNEGSIPSVIPQTFNRSKLCNSLKTIPKTKENVSYETRDERQASSTTASFDNDTPYPFANNWTGILQSSQGALWVMKCCHLGKFF